MEKNNNRKKDGYLKYGQFSDKIIIQIIVASKQGKWLVGSIYGSSVGADF